MSNYEENYSPAYNQPNTLLWFISYQTFNLKVLKTSLEIKSKRNDENSDGHAKALEAFKTLFM